MAFIESRKKQSGGGGILRFTVTLTGTRAIQYDYVTSVYTFLSDTAGSLSISVTGLTDCGNNDAYISLELNGTEVSRGTLVTDTSTTVSFPNTSIAVGDTVALNFGWVGNHGAGFNGSADITIACGDEIIVSPIPVTSQMVTASSQVNDNFSGGKAFNGESCNLSTLQGGWLASNSDNTPTLTVNFGRSYTLGKIVIETANNNSPDTDRDVYIEGSNDGSTWVNILATGSTTSLSFIVGEYTQYTINLNEGNYQYFRLRGTQPFFGGSYQYACCFSEILIYDRASQSGGGGVTLPQFSEATIATGTSGGVVTFTGDYHDYDFVDIVCRNSDTGERTDLITTPAALDSIFDINSGLVLNECANNQYGTYYVTNSTTWTRSGARNLYAEEVIGLTCINGTVTETEIYNKGSYDTSQRALTGLTDLFSYDMFIVLLSSDGIQPNCFQSYGGFVKPTDRVRFYTSMTPYNDLKTIVVTDTSMSSTYYHYVGGIKFT